MHDVYIRGLVKSSITKSEDVISKLRSLGATITWQGLNSFKFELPGGEFPGRLAYKIRKMLDRYDDVVHHEVAVAKERTFSNKEF